MVTKDMLSLKSREGKDSCGLDKHNETEGRRKDRRWDSTLVFWRLNRNATFVIEHASFLLRSSVEEYSHFFYIWLPHLFFVSFQFSYHKYHENASCI